MIQNWKDQLIHQIVVIAICRDVARMEGWTDRNFIKLNKRKCQVLHLGRNTSMQQCMLVLTDWKAAL